MIQASGSASWSSAIVTSLSGVRSQPSALLAFLFFNKL